MQRQEQKTKYNSKRYYDKNAREDPLQVGEEVLALLPAGPTGISATWEGPFTILEKPTSLTYKISAKRRGGIGRVLHRNLLKRYVQEIQSVAVVVADGSQGLDQLHLEELPPQHSEDESKEWIQRVTREAELTNSQRRELAKVLEDHAKTFSDKPGLTSEIEFEINTGMEKPISAYPRNPPLRWREQHDQAIKDMVKDGILERVY